MAGPPMWRALGRRLSRAKLLAKARARWAAGSSSSGGRVMILSQEAVAVGGPLGPKLQLGGVQLVVAEVAPDPLRGSADVVVDPDAGDLDLAGEGGDDAAASDHEFGSGEAAGEGEEVALIVELAPAGIGPEPGGAVALGADEDDPLREALLEPAADAGDEAPQVRSPLVVGADGGAVDHHPARFGHLAELEVRRLGEVVLADGDLDGGLLARMEGDLAVGERPHTEVNEHAVLMLFLLQVEVPGLAAHGPRFDAGDELDAPDSRLNGEERQERSAGLLVQPQIERLALLSMPPVGDRPLMEGIAALAGAGEGGDFRAHRTNLGLGRGRMKVVPWARVIRSRSRISFSNAHGPTRA